MMNKEIKPFCRTDSVSNMIIRNSNQIVSGGKKLVRKNSFFEDLSDLMENEKFQKFLGKHMYSMGDIKMTTVYIKLYEAIKLKVECFLPPEETKYVVVNILYHFMTSRTYNPIIIRETLNNLNKGLGKEKLLEKIHGIVSQHKEDILLLMDKTNNHKLPEQK